MAKERIKKPRKPKKEYAVFIMPNRVEEILKEKPNATIDDVLKK